MNIWGRLRFLAIPTGKVCYYDPKTRKYIQAKRWLPNGVLCGGFCNYYEDSQTNIHRQMLSYKYLSKCTKITAIDKLPEAEFCPIVDGWKVKGQ